MVGLWFTPNRSTIQKVPRPKSHSATGRSLTLHPESPSVRSEPEEGERGLPSPFPDPASGYHPCIRRWDCVEYANPAVDSRVITRADSDLGIRSPCSPSLRSVNLSIDNTIGCMDDLPTHSLILLSSRMRSTVPHTASFASSACRARSRASSARRCPSVTAARAAASRSSSTFRASAFSDSYCKKAAEKLGWKVYRDGKAS